MGEARVRRKIGLKARPVAVRSDADREDGVSGHCTTNEHEAVIVAPKLPAGGIFVYRHGRRCRRLPHPGKECTIGVEAARQEFGERNLLYWRWCSHLWLAFMACHATDSEGNRAESWNSVPSTS